MASAAKRSGHADVAARGTEHEGATDRGRRLLARWIAFCTAADLLR